MRESKGKTRGSSVSRAAETHHVVTANESREVIVRIGLCVELGFWGAVVVAEEKSGRICLIKTNVVKSGARFRHWHGISVDPVSKSIRVSQQLISAVGES